MPTTRRYNRSNYRTTNYRRWNTTRTTATRPTTARFTTKTTATTYPCAARAFRQPRTECEWRMASYRNVYTQFTGAGAYTYLSPTTANKWIKFVNNGYRIYRFAQNDFTRYFGMQWNTASPTTCYRWMRRKYGAGIKAVTRGRTNTWLVAATPNVTARPFQNYNWSTK
jgi:hypothetical protein